MRPSSWFVLLQLLSSARGFPLTNIARPIVTQRSALLPEGDGMDSEPLTRQPLFSPVETFTSLTQCLDAMDDTASDYTVVLFFAHYCKLCHQANIPYKKLAYQHPELTFTRLETSILSSEQLKRLEISRVPFVQIYRQGKCVASFSTKWQLATKLQGTLDEMQTRTEQEWKTFSETFQEQIQENRSARNRLRVELLDPSPLPPSDGITTLASERQFLEVVLHSPQPNQRTVVLFHSHFDDASRRAQYQYRRLVEHMQRLRQDEEWKFARVEATALSEVSLGNLGIQSYPHVQIYDSESRCVASFSIPQTYLFQQIVRGTLNKAKGRTNEEWDSFYQDFASEVRTNRQALQEMEDTQLRP